MSFINKDNIIRELKKISIPYRDNLDMSDKATFGVEIETLNVDVNDFEEESELIMSLDEYLTKENSRFVNYYTSPWIVKTDITFELEDVLGTELVSPVLKNTKEDYDALKYICLLLKQKGGSTGYCTGGHIHFGKDSFNNPDVDGILNLLEMWSVFEDIIYCFSTGDYIEMRPSICHYAMPIRKNIMDVVNDFHDFKKFFAGDINTLIWLFSTVNAGIRIENLRANKVFNQNKDTIEVRCPNGTLEHTVWQNNINFFYHFINYALSDNYDQKLMDELFLNMKPIEGSVYNQVNNYLKLDVDKAILLSDLIFDDEIDKLYFLKSLIKMPAFKFENGMQKCMKFYKR